MFMVSRDGAEDIYIGTYRALISGTTIVYALGEQLGGSTNGVTSFITARRVG